MPEDNKIKGLKFDIDVLRTDYGNMSIEEVREELRDVAVIRSGLQSIKNILSEHKQLLDAVCKVKRIEAGEDPWHSRR